MLLSSSGSSSSQGEESGTDDHDDFWSTVKSGAETAPAYQKAMHTAASPDNQTFEWAAPSASGSVLPPGEAYRQGSGGGARSQGRESRAGATHGGNNGYITEPAFDMSHPLHLSPVRKISVRMYNGTMLVDIRQYYKAGDCDPRPLAKGISLTVPQYAKLKEVIPMVDDMIRAQGADPDGV